MSNAWAELNKLLEPLRRRVMLTIGRAVVKATTSTSAVQTAQVSLLKDEVREKVEHFQEYGFTSRPKAGAECVTVSVGGNRDHTVIIACGDRRYRLKGLAEGEVALFTDEGDFAHFKRNRELHVRANKFKFQGSADELMQQLVDLSEKLELVCEKLNTTTTNTMLGPMKLNDFAFFGTKKTEVAAIKNKIIGLKV